jgi:hypothetical protein
LDEAVDVRQPAVAAARAARLDGRRARVEADDAGSCVGRHVGSKFEIRWVVRWLWVEPGLAIPASQSFEHSSDAYTRLFPTPVGLFLGLPQSPSVRLVRVGSSHIIVLLYFILRWMTARNGSPQKHPLRRPLKEKSPARAASSPKPDEKAAYDWSKHAHQYTVKWPDRITQLHSLHPLLLSPARSLAASPSWVREYGSPSPLPAAISRESTARTRESRSASCAAFNEPSRSGTPTQMLLGSRGRAPDMAGEPMKHSLRGSHLGDSPASDSALLTQLTNKIQEQAFSLLRYVARSCVGPHRTHRRTFHAACCATGSAKTTRRRSHTSTSATQRYGCSRRGTRCLCTT